MDYINEVSEDDYHQKIEGINRSMAEIVYHIVEVLGHWYYRLQEKEFLDTLNEGTPRSELLRQWEKYHMLLGELCSKPEEFREITLQWYDEDQPVETGTENILFNFVTHNAYHRGQLALILRYHGFDGIEETDFNPYIYHSFQNK